MAIGLRRIPSGLEPGVNYYFDNMIKGPQYIDGQFLSNAKFTHISYRHFPDELAMNFWGNDWFYGEGQPVGHSVACPEAKG